MDKSYSMRTDNKLGDLAVDGLIAGLVAGLIMALFLALFSLFSGTKPLDILGYFDPARAGNWTSGTLAHLAASATYGLIFALIIGLAPWPSFLRLSWLQGVGYGLALLAFARVVVIPTLDSPLAHFDSWNFALAHVVYGLVLGLWLSRNQ